jgi:multisubunit Na+/H+ antiporter MnhC subunit
VEIALSIAAGALFAASTYLILGRDLVRVAVGILLLGVAANVLIFIAGGVSQGPPPLVPPGETTLPEGGARPLPQALILTAIVISFGLSAFAMVLFWTARRSFGHVDTAQHRLAEPRDVFEAPPSPETALPVREEVRA